MTQQQLALEMGTSQAYIARLEAGLTDPRLSTLERWAGAVGYTKLGVVLRGESR